MQIAVNSANLIQFGFTTRFDLYNRKIIFDTTALTTYNGAGASLVKIAFSVVDQAGVVLAAIDWTAPQIPNPSLSKIFSLDLSMFPYDFLFQTYKIIGSVQEANGTVYSTPPIIKTIGSPVGINDSGYVPGMFQVIPDCVNNNLTVKDLTLLTYMGLAPVSKTTSGTLNYPTGTIAAVPFLGTPFSNNIIYSGQYRINATVVAEYDLGDGLYVDVSYLTANNFDVSCSNRMADLLCCIIGFQKIWEADCTSAIGRDARQKLDSISVVLMTGLLKEINGQDASEEAEFIREKLNCDCGANSVSQNQLNPVNPSAFSIVLTGVGGTSIPAPSINGNSKQFNIASNTYLVAKGDNTDTAYTITTDTSTPNSVQYKISFNYPLMAATILNSIAASPSLLAQLNSLIASAGSVLGLNGSCVIDLTKSTYSLSQAVNAGTLITGITINGVNYAAPANLNANSVVALQNWLNSLTLGTYSASINAGVLTIMSINNTNSPSTLQFSTPNLVVPFQSTSATLVQVLQAIINYLCSMTTLQVTLANNLTLSLFDYNNSPLVISYTQGTKQSDYNLGISQAINNIVQRINMLTGITCNALKNLFQDAPNAVWGASDRIFGTMGGNCAGITDQQLANMVLAAVGKYSDVQTNFCKISCTNPASCPDVVGVNLNVVGGNAALYGVGWSTNPLASQTLTVRYRLHGSVNWIVSTSALQALPNGNLTVSPPYLIAGTVAGQIYDVWVNNNCGGNGFISQITIPTAQIYSGLYKADTVLANICNDASLTYYSAQPFAPGVTMYTNAGLTTPLTGFNYISDSTGIIYNINITTGVVGISTGSSCTNGTAAGYILGNSTGTICNGTPVTLYTSGGFGIGQVLYTDAALTNPQTGYSYVVNTADNHIYNLNASTGAIGADTGLSCSNNTVIVTHNMYGTVLTAITGITGFTPNPSLPLNPTSNNVAVGTHSGFSGTIAVTITGTPSSSPSNIKLRVNGVVKQCLNVTGAGTYNFPVGGILATDVIRIDLSVGGC